MQWTAPTIVSGAVTHGDRHIPFERIVRLRDGTLAMSTTVLASDLCCKVMSVTPKCNC